MSRRFTRGAGLESGSGDYVPSDLGSDEPVDMTELEYQNADVIDHLNKVEDARGATDSLEAIAAGIRSTLGGRGMDRNAAMFAHLAIAPHCDRIGLRNPLPSLEDFGSTNSQLAMTRAGLEDLKSKISDAWKWIIELLQTGIRKVNEYYQRVWAQAPRLIGKAEALRNKANEIKTGITKGKEKLTVDKSSVAAIHVKGEIGTISANLVAVEALGGEVFVSYIKKVSDWGGEVIELVDKIDYADDNRFVEGVTALVAKPLDTDSLIPQATITGTGAHAGSKHTEEFMGGKAIFVKAGASGAGSDAPKDDAPKDGAPKDGAPKTPTTEDNSAPPANEGKQVAGEAFSVADYRAFSNTVTDTRVRLTALAEVEKEFTEKTIPTFAVPEIIKITEAASDLCTIIMNYKSGNKSANDLRQKAITAAKRAQTNSNKANDLNKDNATIAGQLNKVVSAVDTLLTQPNQEFSAHMLKVVSVCLQLCDKSISNYK